MNIKKCEKCGAEYPHDYKRRTCEVCKTEFKMGYCCRCGVWAELLNRGRCSKCRKDAHYAWMEKRRNNNVKAFEDWKDAISKIPTPYKTLTEEEWLEACNHFKGCAFCGNSDISGREMFIQFKDGGRYCAWNIVPACEKCTTLIKNITNPFERMDRTLNRQTNCQAKVHGLTVENLQRISEYLSKKLKEASNERGV